MEKVKNFLKFMLLFVMIFCLLSYLNLDPFKSCLYMVLSMLMLLPAFVLMSNSWFGYFICLIFLSGIFVILVYFSGLSSFNFVILKMSGFVFLVSMILINFNFNLKNSSYNMVFFYFDFFLVWLMIMISILLLFLVFLSYMMNFGGGLRKF